jgi:photosystem II stability/assembly factor-like uncharacterized protein
MARGAKTQPKFGFDINQSLDLLANRPTGGFPMRSKTVRHSLVAAALAALLLPTGSPVAVAQTGVKARSQIVEDLYDTRFIDANTGWVVGVFGSVYHTDDGGKHWSQQKTPTTQHLYSVSFVDV